MKKFFRNLDFKLMAYAPSSLKIRSQARENFLKAMILILILGVMVFYFLELHVLGIIYMFMFFLLSLFLFRKKTENKIIDIFATNEDKEKLLKELHYFIENIYKGDPLEKDIEARIDFHNSTVHPFNVFLDQVDKSEFKILKLDN